MTDSYVAAWAEADFAMNEMTVLSDKLSRLRSAHETSENIVVGSSVAALVRLLGSARRLHAHLAAMDRCAPTLAVHSAAGLRGLVDGLTENVQALLRQASAERRHGEAQYLDRLIAAAVRRYLAVAGDAPTEEQLNRQIAAADDSDSAKRAALLFAVEEMQAVAKELAEVERGLLELQQLFLDMVVLVDALGAAAEEQTEARPRRRFCLAGVAAALVLVAVTLA